MNRDGRSSSHDPAAERSADQSTITASGVSGRPDGPGVERNAALEEVVNRQRPDDTPRRYDQPLEQDESVMPSDDATLNTKI